MLNLMILVTEDDRQGGSHFYLDLANMTNVTKHPNLNLHILYYSLKNHGNYYFHFGAHGHKMEPVTGFSMDPSEYLKLACSFLDKCYDKSAINAFVFSSHCWTFFIRPFRRNINSLPMVEHMEDKHMHFKFILFDCCNTSCVETLYMYRNVTDYLVGCQSACPAIGFLTQEMASILGKHSKQTWTTILKKLTLAFLDRNNEHTIKRDLYETDCVVLTTVYAAQIPRLFDNVTFHRNQNARTQPTPDTRTIFDVVELLKFQDHIPSSKKQEIRKWVKKTVLSYHQSTLMKSKPWAHHLHGVSLILNRETVTKRFALAS